MSWESRRFRVGSEHRQARTQSDRAGALQWNGLRNCAILAVLSLFSASCTTTYSSSRFDPESSQFPGIDR